MTDTDQREVNRQMTRGGAWMIGMRWAIRGLGIFSTLILVRLLAPEDFGVIAMAMIIVGLLDVLAQSGVDLALIRHDQPERTDYDSAWTLQLLISLFMGLILFLVAPYVADFFSEDKLTAVIRAYSIRSVLMGFENIGTIEFRRTFDYSREFRFNVIKRLLGLIVTVAFAFILRDYWARVYGAVLSQCINVLYSYRVHSYRPRLSLKNVRQLVSFSSWLVVQRITRYAARRMDQFIVGSFAGTMFMGRYYVAYDLATSPTNELVMPMARGLYPVYARLQHQPEKLVESFLKALSTVALFVVPIGLGLWATTPVIVPVLLGSKWLDIIPLMETLALFGIFYALGTTIEALLTAIGRVRLLALLGISQMIPRGVILYMVARYLSADYIALARAAIAFAVLPFSFLLVGRVTPLTLGAVFSALWPRFAAGLAMAAIVRLLHPENWSPFLSLPFDIMVGVLCYIVFVYLFWFLRGRPDDFEYGLSIRAKAVLLRLLQRSRSGKA